MKIIVSNACMTGGLISCLKLLLPQNIEFIAQPLLNFNTEEDRQRFIVEIESSDYWFSLFFWRDFDSNYCLSQINPSLQVRQIPQLDFAGFHPDICQVVNHENGSIIINSALALWAYINKIDIPVAVNLFNADVYRSLGFFGQWQRSVNLLERRFIESGCTKKEFTDFFNSVKREGVFMNTFNHPKSSAIMKLALMMAKKTSIPVDLQAQYIEIPDVLGDEIFPLYPEIGLEIGLLGNYAWRFSSDRILKGPNNFLNYVYTNLCKKNIDPDKLSFANENNKVLLDAVLGYQLGLVSKPNLDSKFYLTG